MKTRRRASSALCVLDPAPALLERSKLEGDDARAALDWSGSVRLAVDRAEGSSAAARQEQVRVGLLERFVALGAHHWSSPHLERPEVDARILRHLDALAEAGLDVESLSSFAEGQDPEHPGAMWALALLFGCWPGAQAAEALERWLSAINEPEGLGYGIVLELADALALHPQDASRRRLAQWVESGAGLLQAIALESIPLEQASDRALERAAQDNGLALVALERLLAHHPSQARARRIPTRPSWSSLTQPALAFEVARARALAGDPDALFALRRGEPWVVEVLSGFSVDLLALHGAGSDAELALELSRALPSSPELSCAMGRYGSKALLPRMLADLENEDLGEEAVRALVTMLGPPPGTSGKRGTRPQDWTGAIQALPDSAEPVRYRAGELHTMSSVLSELRRPDLCATEVRKRADEVMVTTQKCPPPSCWCSFLEPLERAISEVARLCR